DAYPETHHSGDKKAADKVAVVSLDGVIFEGLLEQTHKQLDAAAKDKAVKAVVLRINSPGGSVTASEDLHHRITRLLDGDPDKGFPPKPSVASMGSIAASGGYYAAVPAQTIFAEKTTLTASIGVYAAFPNLTGACEKCGFSMNTIKAGEIKDTGS